MSTERTSVVHYKRGADVAAACRELVTRTAMQLGGRRYVRVEGWQAIATAYGCTVRVGDVRRITDQGAAGYAATAEVVRLADGHVVGQAEGFVGDDEGTWAKRPIYARRAMAQTRAISRACRGAFAWVVVMMDAGLDTTPAEEVEAAPPAPAAPRLTVDAIVAADAPPAPAAPAADAPADALAARVDELCCLLEGATTMAALASYWQRGRATLADARVAKRRDLVERMVAVKDAAKRRIEANTNYVEAG